MGAEGRMPSLYPNTRSAEVAPALERLMRWVEARNFTGYDLYDGLTLTSSRRVLENHLANSLVTQFFKKSPVNFRPLLGMPRTKMPKGVGLFLHAYSLVADEARKSGDLQRERTYTDRCEALYRWLHEHACPGYHGAAWNFGFNYKRLYEKPTMVITAVIARGLFAYYGLTGRDDVGRLLRGTCDFVLEDLLITESDAGICFSYTPKDNVTRPKLLDCCYNASMLGAETLAMGYALTGEEGLREYVQQATNFLVAHQNEDGRWNYSIDLESGYERPQVDFHQGFVLDSLQACIQLAALTDGRFVAALERGAAFYRRRQFTEAGRALWRLPRRWPADIHCQAQGILTFCKLARLDDEYRSFAETIARWTIQHMQAEEGFFHYRKGRLLSNKIPYMRWGQGWMMLALAQLSTDAKPPKVASRARSTAGQI